jgi:hypothetical protein
MSESNTGGDVVRKNIKIKKDTKDILDREKKGGESYDLLLDRLVKTAENYRFLKEGLKESDKTIVIE